MNGRILNSKTTTYGCGNLITRRGLLGRQNSTAPGPGAPHGALEGPPGVRNHEKMSFDEILI